MKRLGVIRFWHLMVGTGFGLLVIGLVMIFLPPGVGDNEVFEIRFFEASIESSEMGLAMIVLGLSCFLIGSKDLADLRTYQGVQDNLNKTSTLAARLVADRVAKTMDSISPHPAGLSVHQESTRQDLERLQNGDHMDWDYGETIRQAESGLKLLAFLENKEDSV
jgi:hypothetical protein